jgi:hypothetical protein
MSVELSCIGSNQFGSKIELRGYLSHRYHQSNKQLINIKMASYFVTQKALAILAAEEQQKRLEEQQRAAAAAAEAAAKAEAERAARVQLQAERELARVAAERALAEQAAAEAQAAEAATLQAELARLRARSENQILRDEMAQMRAEITALKARPVALLTPPAPPQEIHLRADGELDMRFKSSREELATARAEIAELKALVRGLCILTNTNMGILGACGGENARQTDWLNSLTQPVRNLCQADIMEARKTMPHDYKCGTCTGCSQPHRVLRSSCGTKCRDNCGK